MAGNLYLQLLPSNTETIGKPGERLIQVGWNVLQIKPMQCSLLADLIFKKKNMFITSKKKCRNSEKSKNL